MTQNDSERLSSEHEVENAEALESEKIDASTAVDQPVAKKRKITPVVIALVVILVICLVGGIAGGMYLVNTYAQIRDVENSQAMEPALPAEVNESQPNPIDFASLGEKNSDIYAWIYVPDTNINYPICQSADNDEFYLDHNAAKEETELGAIFSERRFNHADFNDRVTILYGHNGFGETMFSQLHKFEASDFFNSHDRFYVYAPGHIYTYQIMSAFMSDDRHIMGKYNLQTNNGFAQFVSEMKNPDGIGANTRSIELSYESKILVLSTCNTGALEATGRYLVCGVMVDDQPTK